MLNNSPAFRGNRLADAVYLGGRRLWTRPETLSLDFANDVYRMGSVTKLPTEREFSELITFTRGSGGGITNAQGNYEWLGNGIPRFDYDPITKAVKGLLIEEQRTNLLTYSEQFDNAAWQKAVACVVTPNTAISPDGNLTADSIKSTGTSASDNRSQQFVTLAVTAGTVFTFSVWLRADSPVTTTLRLANQSDVDGENVPVALTSTWARFTVTRVFTASATAVRVCINSQQAAVTVYAWGAQLEQGSFPTSYIPSKATFTARNSIGTYHDSTGVLRTAAADVARYDHGYVDGQWVSKGLLLEGQSTNLLTYSSEFRGAVWNKYDCQIRTSHEVAPDGTLASLKLVSGGSGTPVYQGITQNVPALATDAQFSVYTKAGELSQVELRIYGAVSSTVGVVDLGSQSFISGAGTVRPIGGGWFQISVNAPAGNTAARISLVKNGNRSFSSDGTSGLYIWGAQLEEGDRTTSYIPTPAVFTSRASTKTYFDNTGVMQTAAVDEAAIDHAYIDGQWVSKGLSVEGQATNLLLQSEVFDNASWTPFEASILANSTAAPTGVTSADKLVATATNNNHRIHYPYSVTAGVTYSISVFAKAGEYAQCSLNVSGTNGAAFNLLNGVVNGVTNLHSTNGTVTQATAVDVGGGWFRLGIVFTANVTASLQLRICLGSDVNGTAVQPSFAGDGTSGLYIWGAQLEAGSQPTSYIPTTTAQVTRAADVTSSAQVTRVADSSTSSQVTRAADMASVNDLSGWYRQDEGTLVVEASRSGEVASGKVRAMAVLSDGTFNNQLVVLQSSINAIRLDVATGGVSQASITGATGALEGVMYKVAATYKQNDLAVSVNGGVVATDTSAVIPSVTSLSLGCAGTKASNFLNGHIKSIKYLPRRVSNDELKALSV